MGKIREVTAVALLATSLSGCWLQAGHGPGKDGWNDTESTVTAANVAGLTEAWSVPLPDVPREPLVSGGSAYVRTQGALTALDLATGATSWSASVPGGAIPAVVDGVLQVPTTGVSPSGVAGWCQLSAVDPGSGAVSSPRTFGWYGIGVPSPNLGAFCNASDAVATGGTVVVGTSAWQGALDPQGCRRTAIAGGLAFLDAEATVAEAGSHTLSQCLQTLPPPPLPSPAVVGDTVVATAGTVGVLTAYPVSCTGSCTPAWTLVVGVELAGTVVGLPNGDLAVAAADGTVLVVDGTTHVVSWAGVAGAPLAGPVAADDGSIFATTTDGRLVVFPVGGCGAASCPPSWTAALAAPAGARASIGGDVVYVGSTDGTVTALPADGCGAATCPALWTGSVGAAVSAPPVISDGTLLVGATDGSLTAFALP